jgi:hypothetical protein
MGHILLESEPESAKTRSKRQFDEIHSGLCRRNPISERIAAALFRFEGLERPCSLLDKMIVFAKVSLWRKYYVEAFTLLFLLCSDCRGHRG